MRAANVDTWIGKEQNTEWSLCFYVYSRDVPLPIMVGYSLLVNLLYMAPCILPLRPKHLISSQPSLNNDNPARTVDDRAWHLPLTLPPHFYRATFVEEVEVLALQYRTHTRYVCAVASIWAIGSTKISCKNYKETRTLFLHPPLSSTSHPFKLVFRIAPCFL